MAPGGASTSPEQGPEHQEQTGISGVAAPVPAWGAAPVSLALCPSLRMGAALVSHDFCCLGTFPARPAGTPTNCPQVKAKGVPSGLSPGLSASPRPGKVVTCLRVPTSVGCTRSTSTNIQA